MGAPGLSALLESLLAAGVAAAAPAPDGLAGYRWQARPIVLLSAQDDPRGGAQAAAFAAAAHALAERRHVVVVEIALDGSLRARFGPGFQVVLVGLDGGAKAAWDAPVSVCEIAQLVDAMPMRRRALGGDAPDAPC